MDRIVINLKDKDTEIPKRVVIEVKAQIPNCDFITIGEDLIFDRDTDFFTFGYEVSNNTRQIAIVTGEYLPLPPKELMEKIRNSLAEKFEVLNDDEEYLYLREK
jgi:hypothetical protein